MERGEGVRDWRRERKRMEVRGEEGVGSRVV